MAKDPVRVLDNTGTVLTPTASGKARKLLRNNKAVIHSREPFAIRLNNTVENPRSNKMVKVSDYLRYFSQERDVYIQNISGAQVSVTFNLEAGRVEGFLFPPNKDPINLSHQIPYQAIKNSMDLRKMLNRRPPALQLLEEEDYKAFYENAARKRGFKLSNGKPDIDKAIEDAQETHNRLKDKSLVLDTAPIPEPLHDVIEDNPHMGGKKLVKSRDQMTEDELINPRILHLCQQVSPGFPDNEKMPANQLLDELKTLPTLTADDLEYVRGHGYYKGVKNWAKSELDDLVASTESKK